MKWKFNFVTSWDTISSESFQQQWLHWVESASNSHVFFHPSLCMAWIESYLPLRDMEPIFCVAEKGDSTVFLPLVLWKQNWKNAWCRIIIPVGYSDFDYHDPLLIGDKTGTVPPAHFYVELLDKLSHLFSFDEFILNGLTATSLHGGFSAERDVAPFLPISEIRDREQLLTILPSKLRGDIKRRIKQFEVKGHLSLVQHNAHPDIKSDLLDQFLKIHSARWPGAFKAPQFHANLLRYGSASGIVHFSGLYIDGHVISWHLGFLFKTRFYYYMSAIEPAWAEVSPGKLHLFMLIELAINRKMAVFDMLRGAEAYKTGWTRNHQQIYQLRSSSGKSISKLKGLAIQLKNLLR